MPDQEVLALASRERRILFTGDKDFGDLVFVQQEPAPHGVILIRAADARPAVLTRIVVEALAGETVWGGFFSVTGDGRLRRTRIGHDL